MLRPSLHQQASHRPLPPVYVSSWCRKQLESSEELRHKGQRALKELRGEFEGLRRELTVDCIESMDFCSVPQARSEPHGTPIALQDTALVPGSA